jgi:hypothetical protein
VNSPADSRVTAVVADDEPLLRAQLIAALADAWPGLEIVAEAANGAQAVELGHRHIQLKGHAERLEVSRSFAHLFRGA